MKRCGFVAILWLVAGVATGCGKPDHIARIKSPLDGLYYTVETYYGQGSVVSDTTRVYAHLERKGKTKKTLVLEGGNLTIAKIVWVNPHEATFCLNGGITDTFRNQVTLIVDDSATGSETIHHHLEEHCDAKLTATPD